LALAGAVPGGMSATFLLVVFAATVNTITLLIDHCLHRR
jgi:hypothetical protein